MSKKEIITDYLFRLRSVNTRMANKYASFGIGYSKYILEILKDLVLKFSIINIIPTILAIGLFIDGVRYGRYFHVMFSLFYIIFECILIIITMIILGDIKIKLGQSKKEIARKK